MVEKKKAAPGVEGQRTDEARKADAIVEAVRHAVQRADDASSQGDDATYNYWKGVAHGLNRGWDIHTGADE